MSLGFPTVDEVKTDDVLDSVWFTKPEKTDDINDESNDNIEAEIKKKADKKFKPRPGSYLALGLHRQICTALRRRGYNFPTPVQRKSIPPILAGRDAVVMARTGSGKTAAYLAPVLHRVVVDGRGRSAMRRGNGMKVLILAPTRELALQIWRFWCEYSKGSGIRGAVVVGGESLEAQFEALVVCPEVVIATPGRLLQLLAEMNGKGGLTLKTVEIAVFDEADRLFEGGLAREMLEIIEALGQGREGAGRQTVLVSATMPSALAEFTKTGLKQNVAVMRLDATKKLPPSLATGFFLVRSDAKSAALLLTLRQLRLGENPKSTLIFAATHHRVDFLTELLRSKLKNQAGQPIPVAAVHGSMDQELRRSSVLAFRQKRVAILIVTDVAARGIDLPELDVVINYEYPDTPKLFIHRVGRVARSHRHGLALSMVSPNEVAHVIDTHLVLSQGLNIVPPPTGKNSDNYSAVDMSDWSKWSTVMERTFLIGRIPSSALDEDIEMIKNAIVTDANGLRGLDKTADNAHKMYLKSRKSASGQSYSRGKEGILTQEIGTHPFLGHLESDQDARAAHEVNQLSRWRPKVNEAAIEAPAHILALKRRRVVVESERETMERHEMDLGVEVENGSSELNLKEEEGSRLNLDLGQMMTKKWRIAKDPSGEKKKSARLLDLEEQRARFYVPLQRNEAQHVEARAMNVCSGGGMGDDLRGYSEIRDATMDIMADEKMQMGKRKMVLGNKVWDRKNMKYVHPDAIKSKAQNFNAARNENRGKGKGSKDQNMFRKWLARNRKAVEEMVDRAAAAAEGDQVKLENGPNGLKSLGGIGKGDFRKGAFGRRGRVIAATRAKKAGISVEPPVSGKSELKTATQIKKERKQKAKRVAKSKGRKKRPARPGQGSRVSAGKGRSKVIIRR
eukprot:Plantae.Rhodophyta-Hildenbrandia_rubra.ctg2110.p1 GENE.Plantae.Rhodophyta-Hildenbrandia_rubra.ctg2110~~Plantae.Rhodophyta-Hildenbrandia_rubra.ctg2110.p1  ORF type:complete len:904 (+),score=197.90 Plantae.Rhodophyta-Hildenbrandia_rubra.ctg2110:140-2851(+)